MSSSPHASIPVATALDLPAGSPGGSVELFLDLYTGPTPRIQAHAFMLTPPTNPPRTLKPGLQLLSVDGKSTDGAAYHAYVAKLSAALAAAVKTADIGMVHLQHLTYGAAPALIRALPRHPRIALVHGTDLLVAAANRTQARVLRETVNAARQIVVPTAAMADRLLPLAPTTARARIVQIPWGIPEGLITNPPPRPARTLHGRLRMLYAGRLTGEKGAEQLLRALALAQGVEVSIAAPPAEYRALAPQLRHARVRPHYLGWLPRRQLWQVFADHDVLAMPSTTLEAMGLVALEAQACGLPVLYQPVPGLNETLRGTGLPTDFANATGLARDLARLQTSPGLLDALRESGRRNAARYPLGATADALNTLGQQYA
ncbi:glycosyltransferase family 4 protein [Yinghuangia seranimata]|uniref:glycosyltransferase family 4 protein n=1 Tax=Yinghuangia seranimata TaxID=408067 RepID=UPI00248CB40F|nr:glycosyltransferase family 4 protein [Yinghuangia seranimata]MDI2127154.1 glycosyltransferase family 4 protein [Yinghuangia seranimata]